MQHVQLGSIDIGGGVVATQAWVSDDGPIVLIATRARSGALQNSRLDLQKGMFIDPLPGNRTQEDVTRLVSSVRREARGRYP